MMSDHCIITKKKNKVSPCTFSSTKAFMMMLSVAIIATLVAVSHVKGADFTLDVVEVLTRFNHFVFHFI